MTNPAFPDAPFTEPTRIDVEEAPLAVIRHEGIRVDALADLFDRGYSAIGGLFADGTLTPTGPALALYYGNPMETFDLELGFPVAEPLVEPITVGDLVVRGSELPAGPALASTYVGPYDGLGAAWGELAQSVAPEQMGIGIESYVDDPGSTPPEQLRTDLILTLCAR